MNKCIYCKKSSDYTCDRTDKLTCYSLAAAFFILVGILITAACVGHDKEAQAQETDCVCR